MSLFSNKKHTPLVTVIIPVYNVERYLKECLDSVVNQTYANLEILCIDDGSTDGSPGILSEIAEKDQRVVVIRQENSGVAKARNAGLDRAAGDYIAFLDADDFAENTLYEELARKATVTKADICVCKSDSFADGEKDRVFNSYAFCEQLIPKKKVFSLRDIELHSLSAFNSYVWDKFFRAGFLKKHKLRFNYTRASSDARFTYLALAAAGRISTVPAILVHRRIGRTGALTYDKDYQSFYLSYTGLREDLKAAGLWGRFEQPWLNRVLHASLWYLGVFDGKVNKECFELMKGAWFEDFGLWDKDGSYFMSADQYNYMQQIKQLPYDEFASSIVVQ